MMLHLRRKGLFINGLVLDHGARHPDMAKRSTNCHILTCNVSLEYEKSMVQSGFHYSSAEERERMVKAERSFTDQKVQQVIEFRRVPQLNSIKFIKSLNWCDKYQFH